MAPRGLQPAPGLYIEPHRGTGPSYFQDTFSAMSFITLGDKYGARPPLKGTRAAGKQFQTTFPKKGVVGDAYFTKEFRNIGGSYAETLPQRYLETQPRDKRKKGFLSGDASKRDEAMNSTMSAILAATYKKENKAQNASNERALAEYTRRGYDQTRLQGGRHSVAGGEYAERGGSPTTTLLLSTEGRTAKDPHGLKLWRSNKTLSRSAEARLVYEEGRAGPEFLFDIGRGAETSFCSRSKRERWFEPRVHSCNTTWSQGDKVVQGVEKRLGSTAVNVVSLDIGMGARELQERTTRTKVPVEFESSPHSRRSVLQQQLNRHCGALLPPFTQTSISAAGPPGSTLLL